MLVIITITAEHASHTAFTEELSPATKTSRTAPAPQPTAHRRHNTLGLIAVTPSTVTVVRVRTTASVYTSPGCNSKSSTSAHPSPLLHVTSKASPDPEPIKNLCEFPRPLGRFSGEVLVKHGDVSVRRIARLRREPLHRAVTLVKKVHLLELQLRVVHLMQRAIPVPHVVQHPRPSVFGVLAMEHVDLGALHLLPQSRGDKQKLGSHADVALTT